MPKHIVCHYGELSLKGKNRDFFEKRLVLNMKNQLQKNAPDDVSQIKRAFGRIIISLSPQGNKNPEKALQTLKNIFGLTSFSLAIQLPQDMEKIKQVVLETLQKQKFETFRITTKRSQKNFPLTSEEVAKEVGAYIVEKLGKKVALKNFDANCFIEIAEKYALVYTEKIKGLGGMPVGTAGKALVMLSGGLDSPVAAFHCLKRGLSTSFIHFHSIPYTSKNSVEKVEQLASQLKNFSSSGKIHLVPFADVQKEIMLKTPQKLRILLYRRMMLRIAEKIAQKNKIKALVTGDCLAQVASQTLENLSAVGQASSTLLLRPLICFDKEEIITIARTIGTYEISILPHDDCCTRLMPQKPELHANLEEILEAEKALDIPELIQKTLAESEFKII
ncbi:MAG: hypothetical protein ACD_11C00071G0002 [uncultured bacterium]|nr:MAG: hypothetical protein ACD_11C00071G0002 [uncultured bacterium]HBR71760.1 tRNA 4-thiouridine(8) synthase ThiI [Candidatus Moranbacteria bacterium]